MPHFTAVETIIAGVHSTGVSDEAVAGEGKRPGVGVTGGAVAGGDKRPGVGAPGDEVLTSLSLAALSLAGAPSSHIFIRCHLLGCVYSCVSESSLP